MTVAKNWADLGVAVAEYRFELDVLDVLTELLELPRLILPYTLPHIGRTFDDRAAHRAAVLDRLTERGYASGDDIDDRIVALLRAWADPDVVITMDATEFASREHFLFRSGWTSKHGFHSQQVGDTVVLEDLRPAQVPATVTSMLPPYDKFFAQRAVAIVDDPHAADHNGSDEDDPELDDDSGLRGVREHRGNLRAFFDHEFVRIGLLSLSAAEDLDQPPHRRETLSWADTAKGRFAIVTEPVGDGTLRRTFEPTDGSLITWWITDRAGLT